MKKVAFYTLGCKLNFSETSTIGRQFEERGFKKVEFNENPDVFIINTCSVTENADKKCKKIVKEAIKINPDGYVAIVGCYAQLKPKEISEIKGVDAVLGASEKFRLLDLIGDFKKEKSAEPAQIFNKPIEEAIDFHTSFSINDRTRTFLKVQDGCDFPCAYCTIPLARGKSRSDSIEKIIEAAVQIGNSGVKEIVLTGVNIGDFGIVNGEKTSNFLELIKELDKIETIERFRISSIEPQLLTDEIIEFVASSKRFVPHFHVPLQSGSNKVLGLMKRRYKRELYVNRVSKIKELMPNACIGVDVIVGHPGETKDDFIETQAFLSDLDVSYLHVFSYSERANTLAVAIKPKNSKEEINERSQILHLLSDKKRRYFYESQIGKTYSVLFEEEIRNGMMEGFTENYVKVTAKYDPMLVGETKNIVLQSINAEMLVEVIDADIEVLSH